MPAILVVPLDGSSFGEFALPPAVEIARRARAKLELLSVDDTRFGASDDAESDPSSAAPVRRYLEEILVEVAARSEGEVEYTIRRGEPAECIADRAREAGADMVVMATHGRGPLSRFWLGSVTDGFVRRAPCPVLVVRPTEDAEPSLDRPFGISRILVPVDRTEVSVGVVDGAVRLGRLFDARFRLLTVISNGGDQIHPYLSRPSRLDEQWLEEASQEARLRLETLAARLRERGIETEVAVVRGKNTAARILEDGREWNADVIAMGTHGRGGLRRTVLGSVADKVLRASRTPVLLQRPSRD